MAIFFSLFATALSSIFYGTITTAVIMAVLYFLLKLLSAGIVKSIQFYIIGIVLAILLIVDLTVLIGAFQVKDITESMEVSLRQLTENKHGTVNANESQIVFDYLIEEYPMLGSYLQLADFNGNNVSELSTAIPYVIRKELNNIIIENIFWVIGYIIEACILAVLFEKNHSRYGQNHTRRRTISTEIYNRRRR